MQKMVPPMHCVRKRASELHRASETGTNYSASACCVDLKVDVEPNCDAIKICDAVNKEKQILGSKA